tara:strand:+ start:44 stop:289 length:246 start_codon:yes stop_codon:yes gene_type:complete
MPLDKIIYISFLIFVCINTSFAQEKYKIYDPYGKNLGSIYDNKIYDRYGKYLGKIQNNSIFSRNLKKKNVIKSDTYKKNYK